MGLPHDQAIAMTVQHHPPFEWVQFPEERARFSGSLRGVDEIRHETFAVEVGGTEYFGEIKRFF